MIEWTTDFTASFHNYLSRGCRICHQGASLVLFVTGHCKRGCFYCPLSAARRGKDHIFANERRVEGVEDILDEAHAIGALGTGITGGEPLLELDLVVRYLKSLKKEFGEEHHVHLYTGSLPGSSVMNKLRQAGLDEIRFHPPVSDWARPHRLVDTLKDAKSMGLAAGVEIPALEPAPLVVEAVKRADAFLNLNELEFSETNRLGLEEQGFISKGFDCGAIGCEEMAREHFMIDGLRVHYCSSRFKDAVQLRERLKRRAERTSRPFDLPTADGTLIYGTVTCDDLGLALNMLKNLGVPPEMYSLTDDRLEIAGWILESISEDMKATGSILALEERYPIEGGPVVERIPL
ncbi:MAG: 4Fe-4S cluster-binding domain-containing protein [Methanothrix sp.]|nr:MAG: 4Fe-4S cluster-binding domain-containing protein [Methanothrix sp.]